METTELLFDSDEAVPLVGFHGRENPSGGVKSLGFIWYDLVSEDCQSIDPEWVKGEKLTPGEAANLYSSAEQLVNEDFEAWQLELAAEGGANSMQDVVDMYFNMQSNREREAIQRDINTQEMEVNYGVIDANDGAVVLDLMQALVDHEEQAEVDRQWLADVTEQTEEYIEAIDQTSYEVWTEQQHMDEVLGQLQILEETIVEQQAATLNQTTTII